MSLFAGKTVLHHFKICFPLPLEKYHQIYSEFRTVSKTYKTSNAPPPQQFASPSMDSQKLLKIVNFCTTPSSTFSSSIGSSFLTQSPSLHFPGGQGYISGLLHRNCRGNNPREYRLMNIDPYCLIGDIGTAQKSYRNIKKLLDILGVKYE